VIGGCKIIDLGNKHAAPVKVRLYEPSLKPSFIPCRQALISYYRVVFTSERPPVWTTEKCESKIRVSEARFLV
jgi:hypothetical protein